MSTTSPSAKRKPQADAAETPAPTSAATGVRSVTHEVLFEVDGTIRCDACGTAVAEDDGARVSGRGLLVFARGDEVRYEEPHLCDECAAAVGITQHRLWDLEDDEEG